MTIEELFAQVTDKGFRVNNLFQRDDGTWQANLRTADEKNNFGGFGRGKTPLEALGRALRDVPPVPAEPEPAPKSKAAAGVFD